MKNFTPFICGAAAIILAVFSSFAFFVLKPPAHREGFLATQLSDPSPVAFSFPESLAPRGASLSGQTAVSFANGRYYIFTYSEGGNRIAEYEIDTRHPDVMKGLMRIKETVTHSFPLVAAGTSYRTLDSMELSPQQLASVSSVYFRHRLFGSIVSFFYTDNVEGMVIQKRYDFELRGKTLIVHAYTIHPRSSAQGNYTGIVFGPSAQTVNSREILIPDQEAFTPIVEAGAPGNEFFFSTYWDNMRSNSNEQPELFNARWEGNEFLWTSYNSRYIGDETGSTPPLDETMYLTVSRTVEDLFTSIHRPSSLYRNMLSDRVILDIWFGIGGPPDTYLRDKFFVERAKQLGMDNLVTVIEHWQNSGFDCGNPTHFPADPRLGSDEDFRSLVAVIKSFGWRVALREMYPWMSEQSSYWNQGGQQALARKPDGLSKAFPDACGTGYVIAVDKMLPYADRESRLIRDAYGPNAAYFDVSTSMRFLGNYGSYIDFAASNPNARTWRDVIRHFLALHAHHRDIYRGPVFGEGVYVGFPGGDHRNKVLQAGIVDAVEGELRGGRLAGKVIPDYELKEIKPLMANWGMGKHSQWDPAWAAGSPRLSTFGFDQYRATQIAYGHTGYMAGPSLDRSPYLQETFSYWAKEYYTFRDLQSQYLAAPVQQILYENPSGALVDLNQALKGNLDFKNAKLKITYQNGLVIYINRHQSQMWTVNEGGRTYYLPPNGWAAVNPSLAYTNYSALVDANGNPSPYGYRADYVKSRNYIMVDGRGVATNFGLGFAGQNIITKNLYVEKPNGWKLRASPDGRVSTPDTPTPSIISLNPNVMVTSGANQEITISGSGFERYSVVRIDGSELPMFTTYVDPRTLRFTVPAGLPAYKYRISVIDIASGLISNERTFEIRPETQSERRPTAPPQ